MLNVLSESFLHLLLWLISRQPHPNFINVRIAYASKIWAQLTKNLLTNQVQKDSESTFDEKGGINYVEIYCHTNYRGNYWLCDKLDRSKDVISPEKGSQGIWKETSLYTRRNSKRTGKAGKSRW